ncbi:hypothetical protein [Lachnotalea glycerini]|nr:hypothetical protein [Lachnotalea glycerini]
MVYNHISQEYYVLHSNFPDYSDEVKIDISIQYDEKDFCVENCLVDN